MPAERDLAALLCDALPQLGIEADAARVGALLRFVSLLAKWSKAYNLTSIRDQREMLVKHVLDGLSARVALSGVQVLDVGTGAGLPGLPLALCEPDRQFTLLDSVGKKVRFVRHVVAELALANVTVVQARVQQYEPEQSFDTVICRAFSSLADFARSCGRLAGPDGQLVAMKGQLPETELALLPGDWVAADILPVSVPLLDAARHLVVLRRRS